MIHLQNLHLIDMNIKPNSKTVACSSLLVSKTECDIKELRKIQTSFFAPIQASPFFPLYHHCIAFNFIKALRLTVFHELNAWERV